MRVFTAHTKKSWQWHVGKQLHCNMGHVCAMYSEVQVPNLKSSYIFATTFSLRH